VLSVDDAHCCDDASVELLRRVARMMARRPWLLVVSGRTVPVVLDELASARLILGPIAVDAATELVLLDDVGQTLPPHVVRGVVARADGNPLFLRTLSAVAAAAGSDTGLPETLEELLTAQIDELAPALRRTLRVAAVLGMRFEESLVAELLGDSVHDGTWHDLADFIDVEQAGTCRFRTALARDAAYEGLPYRTRVDLHRRAGDLLRARAGSEADELAEPLSLHYFAGQRFADAWRYARIAADRARHAFANAEALTLYERARAAARKLPDLPTADVADVLESLADMHARLLAIEPAVAAYREARRLTPADDVLRRARLALRAGLVVAHGGAPDRFNRWMSLAQRELGAGDPDNPELGELDARIWVERAYLQFNLGRDARATTMCERAIALAERLGVGAVIGRGLHLLDLLDVRGGRGSDEARMQRVLALFVRAGDLSRQGGTWNHLGLTAYFRGEWGRAVGCYREAQQLFERCGYEWAAAMAAANVGEILLDQGRLDEAEPLVAAALRVCRVSGAPTDVGFTAALLGTLYARKGRHLDATELLSEAGASYAVTGERFELVDVDLRAAEALLLTGRTVAAGQRLAGAAERLLEAAAAAGVPTGTGGQLPMTPLTARLLRLEGVATQQLGETDVGVAQLRESLAVARRRRSQHDLLLALASLRDADAVAAHEAAELEAIALDLGITWLPTPPRRMADPGEIVVPAQRTTRQERV
jgi:tetratricopeptide (TPR) repeat protein